MKKVNIGFFPAHPSQIWMMHALASSAPQNIEISWYIRDKDIMVQLAKELSIDFQIVSVAGEGILGNAFELLCNIFRFLKITKKDKIEIWFSKYGAVNIAAWLLRTTNYSFNDDDADIVPFIAMTSYPFSKHVFCTKWTRMGKYEKLALRYPSFHELYYLHPNRFQANLTKAREFLNIPNSQTYALIRLSSLKAHHDLNQTGVSDALLFKLISQIEQKHRIYISSERPLRPEIEKFRVNIPMVQIHTILSSSSLVIGDSQTMIAEASVLGIPNLRISSFKGKLGYLDELERRELTKSVKPGDDQEIITALKEVMKQTPFDFDDKKIKLISETVDPISFIWKHIKADT
ncbi:MAG: putative glycosyltransferase [Patiriisocius sp.]|jgi:predicted glycosyltransferase